MKNKLLLITFTILSFVNVKAQVKSPSDFLGYELGSQFSRHADVVDYFKYIAENSPLVTYHTYGKTNERRPLTYVVISTKENLGKAKKRAACTTMFAMRTLCNLFDSVDSGGVPSTFNI